MMIKDVQHIIFDLGGVLLNIDYQLTEDAFVKLGIERFADIYSQLQQTSLFDDFEVGAISAETFVSGLIEKSGLPLAEKDVVAAWNAMLLEFPIRRLQLLQQLRNHYDLVLLSNTNIIHEEAFNKLLMQAHGIPNLGVFFDRVYLSHRVGMRKPNVEVFKRILSENQFAAANTLFIDDSPQHIEGAKKLGIRTIWLQQGMTIEKDVFKPIRST